MNGTSYLFPKGGIRLVMARCTKYVFNQLLTINQIRV